MMITLRLSHDQLSDLHTILDVQASCPVHGDFGDGGMEDLAVRLQGELVHGQPTDDGGRPCDHCLRLDDLEAHLIRMALHTDIHYHAARTWRATEYLSLIQDAEAVAAFSAPPRWVVDDSPREAR